MWNMNIRRVISDVPDRIFIYIYYKIVGILNSFVYFKPMQLAFNSIINKYMNLYDYSM